MARKRADRRRHDGDNISNEPGQPCRLNKPGQTYADGARIHTNSWGGPTGINANQTAQYGGYVQPSQQVGQAAWENKDLLILFSAGNEGADDNKNGVVDPDSIGQPGTAKNVLTIGASEDEHPTFPATWTTGYGYATPIVNTLRADNRNGTPNPSSTTYPAGVASM